MDMGVSVIGSVLDAVHASMDAEAAGEVEAITATEVAVVEAEVWAAAAAAGIATAASTNAAATKLKGMPQADAEHSDEQKGPGTFTAQCVNKIMQFAKSVLTGQQARQVLD